MHGRCPRSSPGRLVITAAAANVLADAEVALALRRHLRGDWGELAADDRRQNEAALAHGGTLFSIYRTPGGQRFYVLTEPDPPCTTVLLPDDD